MVVTRAREQASGLAAQLADLGAEVIQFPHRHQAARRLLQRRRRRPQSRRIRLAHLHLSPTASNVSGNALEAQGLDASCPVRPAVAAIGPATAQAVRTHGIAPDFVPEAYIAESVAEGLIGLGMDGKKVLLPAPAKPAKCCPKNSARPGRRSTCCPSRNRARRRSP
ncbi:MAG: uroporphyrinogen-III synthase [Bilophila wadsworthia]